MIFVSSVVYPQDTLKPKPHSPNKAALFSAIIPGAGQVYNKKYWKIPVVYAGFGTLIYFIDNNNKEFKKFRDAYSYKASANPDLSKYNDYVDKYPLSSLLEGRDYYRRNRDLCYIITSVWYVLNVVDAAVDAHLFDYDVSDNLGISLKPKILPLSSAPQPTFQLSVSFQFK